MALRALMSQSIARLMVVIAPAVLLAAIPDRLPAAGTGTATFDASAYGVKSAQKAEAAATQLGSNASRALENCSRTLAGKAVAACVTQTIEGLATELEKNAATRSLMSKTIESLKGAAVDLKGAATKEQAISAMEKARAVLAAAMDSMKKQPVIPGFGPQKGILAISATLGVAIAAIQKTDEAPPQVAMPVPVPATTPTPTSAPAANAPASPTATTQPAVDAKPAPPPQN